jgi:hypothetical protein
LLDFAHFGYIIIKYLLHFDYIVFDIFFIVL